MSFLSRVGVEMGNAIVDAYGNIMLGDDAGKSAKLVFVARPHVIYGSSTTNKADDLSTNNTKSPRAIMSDGKTEPTFDLGMTFIEVNNRAYVKSVTPDCEAALAGVQPRDVVQFAFVHTDVKISAEDTASDQDDRAAQYALEEERKGERTTFEQFSDMFPFDITSSSMTNSFSRNKANGTRNRGRRSLPGDNLSTSSISIDDEFSELDRQESDLSTHLSQLSDLKRLVKEERKSHQYQRQNTDGTKIIPLDINGDPLIYPVTIVFRRTRQRKRLVGGGLPHLMMPSFRMDDECDRASLLVQKLAPTPEMTPVPDAWDEIVHDGTEWLFPDGSIFPPKRHESSVGGSTLLLPLTPTGKGGAVSAIGAEGQIVKQSNSADFDGLKTADDTIPPDPWETSSTAKLEIVKQRMLEEERERQASGKWKGNGAENVEAAAIRSMIKKAAGLAFLRISKVVLGVSVHAGGGIVIARLSDDTWSAPSAIGTYGLGLGFQFGLEVADYIFILQTEDSLAHFKSGAHFTVGGAVGAAVAGLGREAYGAASVRGNFCNGGKNGTMDDDTVYSHEDSRRLDGGEDKAVEVAPIVAYAKSQGLYFGVTLEGSRVFTRNDLNARAYKFTCGREVTAEEILCGKVPTPPEAEDLYATLHSVEFAHKLSFLPRPPDILRGDSSNEWRYHLPDATASAADNRKPSPAGNANSASNAKRDLFNFFSGKTDSDTEEFSEFETKFKTFLFEGVSVQQLMPNAEPTGGKTRRERRTLWLMLPEVGSLRLGYLSKVSDRDSNKSDRIRNKASSSSRHPVRDDISCESDEYSTDGGRSSFSQATEYSDNFLTDDNTSVSTNNRDGALPISGFGAETPHSPGAARRYRLRKGELSGKYSMALTDVICLTQEPKVNIRFSPDDATEHLRLISIKSNSGTSLLFLANSFREAELLMCGLKFLLERETSRLGVRGGVQISQLGGERGTASNASVSSARFVHGRRKEHTNKDLDEESLFTSLRESNSNIKQTSFFSETDHENQVGWSKVSGRDSLQAHALEASYYEEQEGNSIHQQIQHGSAAASSRVEQMPVYAYSELIIREISSKIVMAFPLPLCRALLLDSNSPVMAKWEVTRGDFNYSKSTWVFPPGSSREKNEYLHEHQLISSGSMVGAHRTVSFDRPRNSEVVHLSETYIVDADDEEKVAITIIERTPRRGFSIKIRILFRALSQDACEGTILTEIRPMGKNMTNQMAVHKAFTLVINEISMRYGTQGKGLLAAFHKVLSSNVSNRSEASQSSAGSKSLSPRHFHAHNNQKTVLSSIPIPRETDVSAQSVSTPNPSPSPQNRGDRVLLIAHDELWPKETKAFSPRERKKEVARRRYDNFSNAAPFPSEDPIIESDDQEESNAQRTIQVKPLPKIRLSLMPAPREEDEENSSSVGGSPAARSKSATKKRNSLDKRHKNRSTQEHR